ncbi:hypothetical protein GCM10007108_16510 [Thermogymnomonas acidicola]|uniref:HVO-0163 N-terminal HTH domain-containing protein n=1 Tax=Thermogymnomonas acidicola TaxID=399579 RepID=A0AA37BSI5_9ARCH|nr:winged helix-turn-helix transcriptional regulator [Thermogymnomonas acidicola]GGM79006.1 hypothetical protein GCM10007108_16510 [Thermogymnomonas acidicola]
MRTDSSVREDISEAIRKNPGIHFRELQRMLGLAVGQLEYHLYRLEVEGRIFSRQDGRYRRYFPGDEGTQRERTVLIALRNPDARKIVQALFRQDMSTEVLRAFTGLRRKRFEGALAWLRENGVVTLDGDTARLSSREEVSRVITRYRESFIGTLADNFLSLFD